MLGCCVAIATLAIPLPGRAAEISPEKKNAAAVELSKMFSLEIRNTLNACTENGGVNLAKTDAQGGFVVCSDGNQKNKVPYKTYLSTFSDFVSAGFLVGFQAALDNDPQSKASSQALQALFQSESGQGLLKDVLTSALSNTQAVASGSRESLDILVQEVLTRTRPILQDSEALEKLLGNDAQYQQIVTKFCTDPGMSVTQAQAEIPGVSNLQLYASCIKASGLTEDIKQEENAETNPTAPSSEPPKAQSSSL